MFMKKDSNVMGEIIEKNKLDELKRQQELIEKLKERGLTGSKQE